MSASVSSDSRSLAPSEDAVTLRHLPALVRKWNRQEKVWQDIYTRTVSSLLALYITALLGVATGIVKLPWARVLRIFLVPAMFLGLAIGAGYLYEQRFGSGALTLRPRDLLRYFLYLTWLGTLVGLFVEVRHALLRARRPRS